jgi:hypothetical protein
VKRFIALLVGCVLLATAVACGGSASGAKPASVTVKPGPILETDGHKVYVFLLAPTGKPSGVVALKSVRDGRVRTIDHVRFTAMTGAGSVAVEVEGRRILAFWAIPSKETASAQRSETLPARSVSDMTAWGSLTATPEATDAEQAFWTQDRYNRPPPDTGGTLCGGPFSAVVRASKETPAKTSYCLTIKLVIP